MTVQDPSAMPGVDRGTGSTAVRGRRPQHADRLPASAVADAALPVQRRKPEWLRSYCRRVVAVDVLCIVLAVAVAQWADVGVDDTRRVDVAEPRLFYLALGALIAAAWLGSLNIWQAWSTRHLGAGPEEYTRIMRGTATVFGILTVVSVALRLEEFRGYLFVSAPLGVALLLAGRWLQRRHLGNRRRAGRDHYRVLLVGRPEAAQALITTMHRDIAAGHQAVGICLPANDRGRSAASDLDSITVDGQEIPLLGTWEQIESAVLRCDACTVAVMSSESLDAAHMRELSWRLDSLGVDMVVAPNLVDVHQMRVTTRPVAGLPLLHIEGPRYELANRVAKSLFDRIGAALILLALSPVMLGCALAVRLSSRGPIFYTADRIGLDGRPFPMVKFRSMVTGADRMRAELVAQSGQSDLLFKLKDDPRITPVGKILRRYSLDELPQLFNVLAGQMSLVGPRPQVTAEVELYDDAAARRLYVRPGMTGLWQVSGRSKLSWEEALRLDLSYVENWSMGLDIIILWRTARAVIGSDGAY